MGKRPRIQQFAPYEIWGREIEADAIRQMDNACTLPISIQGALMPDAHMGYGLPIGGVLAVKDAVIPYAVGVDIACRVKMSVLDLAFDRFEALQEPFRAALEQGTRFGMGESFKRPHNHRVMDEDWTFCPTVKGLKDKAWQQLGTSGSGNHFAEFGLLTLSAAEMGLEPGNYLALLTHSGSRGAGAAIAKHYSTLARRLHPELPKHLSDLAWLDLDRSEGLEYWKAMELMGRYSSANHDIIHQSVLSHLGAVSVLTLENHHNFAWKMQCGDEEVIVHRKGATPADRGVLGVIPGSMATPGFVVRGLGNTRALNSAAHGAGRKMSRNAAIKQFSRKDLNRFLEKKGVTLVSAGLDEVPMAYKDILDIMAQQKDLVETIARFDPKLVKMAEPDGKGRRKQKR
ncbi:RtcB [Desulforapulum autotrophicum HRM2]|uniref:3'-phosphate/5'-hydroxy nucleic acid ligase n=1 Tax=Desulforapulum autotrophicum (strain ATCC 43914 / DSM 3382 / VKM B-1955 / HRM2) TaxID=177437 RepID=C0QHT4_DESAH|nr:RtcB family protein [Desulforapulum autotrophicum]ACN13642.1 RtcB [Desulforapulum autotrophicum HRM2]